MLCGSQPWNKKKRCAQEMEVIQVRFLRPRLERKTPEGLSNSFIPNRAKKLKQYIIVNHNIKTISISLNKWVHIDLQEWLFDTTPSGKDTWDHLRKYEINKKIWNIIGKDSRHQIIEEFMMMTNQ